MKPGLMKLEINISNVPLNDSNATMIVTPLTEDFCRISCYSLGIHIVCPIRHCSEFVDFLQMMFGVKLHSSKFVYQSSIFSKLYETEKKISQT